MIFINLNEQTRTSIGLPPPPPPPVLKNLAFGGDSITAQIGSDPNYNAYGVWSWASSKLNQNVNITGVSGSHTFSLGGINSLRFVNEGYLDAMLRSSADTCVFLLGTNDYYLDNATGCTGRMWNIIQSSFNSGKNVVLCDILPMPVTGEGGTGKAQFIKDVNSGFANFAQRDSRIIRCDWNKVLDPDNDGVIPISYFFDGIHPHFPLWQVAAPYMADVMRPYVEQFDVFSGTQWVSPNPLMTGNHVGWTLEKNTAALNVTEQIISRGATGNWVEATISGNFSGSYVAQTYYRYGFGTPLGGWSVGDQVDLITEFEVLNASTCFLVHPNLAFYGSNGLISQYSDFIYGQAARSGDALTPLGYQVSRTPRTTIPSGTTSIFPFLIAFGTGKFKIGRMGVRKV